MTELSNPDWNDVSRPIGYITDRHCVLDHHVVSTDNYICLI